MDRSLHGEAQNMEFFVNLNKLLRIFSIKINILAITLSQNNIDENSYKILNSKLITKYYRIDNFLVKDLLKRILLQMMDFYFLILTQ